MENKRLYFSDQACVKQFIFLSCSGLAASLPRQEFPLRSSAPLLSVLVSETKVWRQVSCSMLWHWYSLAYPSGSSTSHLINTAPETRYFILYCLVENYFWYQKKHSCYSVHANKIFVILVPYNSTSLEDLGYATWKLVNFVDHKV